MNHKLIILFKMKIFVLKIIIQISYWVNNTESRAWLKAFLSILKFILALGIYSIDPYCATCCSALGSDRVSRLCVKYLLWVSEGIGGYRKWRSIVYIYGFEKGYRKLTEYEQVLTISIQKRVSEILEGYRKCTNGIRNIRRVSEMYEGYRKIKKLNSGFQ